MKNEILFSIVMPTFRREAMIGASIQSVLDQSFENWELIIVENGNEKKCLHIVKSFRDERIIYLSNKRKGRSLSRNQGIEKANGSFLCFLDDDDLYHPDFLLEMHEFILKNKNEEGIYFCNQDQITLFGEIILAEKAKTPLSRKIDFLINEIQNLQTFCISRSIFENHKFGENFEIGEDFHFLMRIFLLHPIYFLDKSLCLYRNHEDSTMERELKEFLYLDQRNNRLNALDNLWKHFQEGIRKENGQFAFRKKYNKILLFYLINSMKGGKWTFFLSNLFKLKCKSCNFSSLLQFSSIILRLPFYLFKSLIFSK